MSGITDLSTLLTNLKPRLDDDEFVFITREAGSYGDGSELNPIAAFAEQEGLTLVVPKALADAASEQYDGVFRKISLEVHSSLDAVGLTAAVTQKLSQHEISANVIAAFYHDHVFVPASRAEDAVAALGEFRKPKT